MSRIAIRIRETKERLKERADNYWKLYTEANKKVEALEKENIVLKMDLNKIENKLNEEKEKVIVLQAKFEMLKNLFKPSILNIDSELPSYGIKAKEDYFKEI